MSFFPIPPTVEQLLRLARELDRLRAAAEAAGRPWWTLREECAAREALAQESRRADG